MRAAIATALFLCSSFAFGDSSDFRIRQLGNPAPGEAAYNPEANANFRVFVRELGAALTSINLMPPETLGHAGFSLTAELGVIDLRTRGFTFPTERPLSGPMLLPSIHVRKGLPFSFELGARATWIDKSRMGAATGELKWALNEGLAHFPDVGVRGHITRLLNSRGFDLTAAGVDFGVGKQFPIGGMITLTPYAGWNLVWVGALSENIDFRPERTHEQSTSSRTEQLFDTEPYENVNMGQNRHNRFYGGVRFISGVLQLGAEVSYSHVGQFRDAATGTLRKLPPVLAFNTSVGLDF